MGQEFLYLVRIPPESSGFLRIPVPAKSYAGEFSTNAKTKAPDDDNVRNNGVGMVVVVIAASGTLAFVPVDRCPPRLVDNRYPVAVPPPLSI